MNERALLAASALAHGHASALGARLVKIIEQAAKTKCIECGAKLPPGKAGRKCKVCRE